MLKDILDNIRLVLTLAKPVARDRHSVISVRRNLEASRNPVSWPGDGQPVVARIARRRTGP